MKGNFSALTLKPSLYIVNHSRFSGQAVMDPFRGEIEKDFIKVSNLISNYDTWLIPKRYQEYDDVAKKATFNIGGFIVADSSDEKC